MDTYKTDSIRNVAILGHGGAGKTTLTEAMAHLTGLTTRMGTVTDGNTISDYDKEEIKRKFSISTAVVPVEWKKTKINLLDTPGFFDFVGEVEQRLKQLLIEICSDLQVDLLEMEVMPDHVHLLLEVDPQYGVHKTVKQIKGRTSHVLRDEFKHLTTKLPTLWTNSYFVSTVGGAPLDAVKQYIESQKTSQRQ